MKPVSQLTLKDVQTLRRQMCGTNGRQLTVTQTEVEDMHRHLQTLFTGTVQMSFAEKIAYRNKAYDLRK